MGNSYFVFSDTSLKIKRFHICTWEFNNNTALVEFGCEFDSSFISNLRKLNIGLYIPWLSSKLTPNDLYVSLRDSDNSRFIFNDAVKSTESLDNGANNIGVIHHFSNRDKLALLPVKFSIESSESKVLNIEIDLSPLFRNQDVIDTNVYVRFYLEPSTFLISTRKNRIGSTKIIYDTKLNELRNLPQNLQNKTLCDVCTCFNFNIVPNDYELSFFDTDILQSVRALEYDSFKKYLPDTRVKDEELLVIFSKQDKKFNFFTSFSKERIGTGQFALAILINLICGILLTLPSYKDEKSTMHFPTEFWWAITLVVGVSLYFFFPFLKTILFKAVKKFKK